MSVHVTSAGRVLGGLAVLFSVPFGDSRCAADQPDHKRVISSIIEAERDYLSRFQPRIVVMEGETRWPGQEPVRQRAEARSDGSNLVVISEVFESGEWKGTVIGSNREYMFELRRESRNEPWVLTELLPVNADTNPTDRDRASGGLAYRVHLNRGMLQWPFKVHGPLLSEYLLHPAVRITDIQEIADESGQFLLVDFDVTDRMAVTDDGHSLLIRGARIKLDRSRGLLPVKMLTRDVSARRELHENVRVHSEFVEQNGIFIPTRRTRKLITDGGEPVQIGHGQTTHDFTTELPYHEFTLSAFGLSEPGNLRRDPVLAQWLIAGGILLLVVGTVLLHRLRAGRHA